MMQKIVFSILLAFVFNYVIAQKAYKRSLNSIYGNKHQQSSMFKSNRRMSKICPGFKPNEYPFQGIGIKLGDPFALTYKLYALKSLALSVDFGTAAFPLYNTRYKALYDGFSEAQGLDYLRHRTNRDIFMSMKIAFRQPTPDFIDNFAWYIFGGWQMRYANVAYIYNEDLGNNNFNVGGFYKRVDYMGPELGIGFEYSNFDAPLSLFLEFNSFYDIVYVPQLIKTQGGIGARYIF